MEGGAGSVLSCVSAVPAPTPSYPSKWHLSLDHSLSLLENAMGPFSDTQQVLRRCRKYRRRPLSNFMWFSKRFLVLSFMPNVSLWFHFRANKLLSTPYLYKKCMSTLVNYQNLCELLLSCATNGRWCQLWAPLHGLHVLRATKEGGKMKR